jgi:hypothetical protein
MGAGFNLPEESELLGIIQNKVSLFNNVPRTVAAARAMVQDIQTRAQPLNQTDTVTISNGSSAYEVSNLSEVRSTGTDMIVYLRTVMIDIAGRIQGNGNGTLLIQFSYDPARDQVIVWSTTHNIEQPVLDMLSTRDFFNTLRQVFKAETARSLTVNVPLQDGRAVLSNFAFAFGDTMPPMLGSREAVINNLVPLRGE